MREESKVGFGQLSWPLKCAAIGGTASFVWLLLLLGGIIVYLILSIGG